MRTIAALTMVMAVVVAAIPVENYGTMQASGVDRVNLKADAEEYLWNTDQTLKNPLYNAIDNEDLYNGGDVKTAQHIEGDSFIDAYEITLRPNSSNDAMISKSVFKADLEKFDIYEEEYYDYIYMDSDYLEKLYAHFQNETYELKYSKKETTYTAKTVNTTLNGNPITLTFDAVTAGSVDMDTEPTGATSNLVTGSLSITSKNSYIDINSTRPDVVKIYREYAPNMLKEHTDKLNKFNTDMKVYTDVLAGIDAKGNNVTQQDVDNWNRQ